MKKTILLLAAMVAMSVLPAKAWDNMYVIGNATGSWELKDVKPMNKISECEFELTLYLWTTEKENDGFKFLTAKDSWAGVYAPNSDNWQIERNWKIEDLSYSGENTSSHNFGVKANGWYTLHINTAVEYTDEESGETKTKVVLSTWPMELYPVGSGCQVGWDNSGKVAFKETAFASGVYQGLLELSGNAELKFLCQKEWGPHYGPKETGEGKHNITGNGEVTNFAYCDGTNDKDMKWWVMNEAKGTKQIIVNVAESKLVIADAPATSVENATLQNDNIVYDIMGRALGTSVENLPQGIYVRNGKKFVVAQ